MNIQFHSSVIFCNNIKEQRDFYEKFLGQKVQQDLGVCLVFEKGFTLWKLDKRFPIVKELGYTYEPIGNRNLELCFETDSFEDAVENILTADLRILHNVAEEEWGQYTIRFYDPEGNLVEIGETLSCMIQRMQSEGKSIKQIAEQSGLAPEYVDSLLRTKSEGS